MLIESIDYAFYYVDENGGLDTVIMDFHPRHMANRSPVPTEDLMVAYADILKELEPIISRTSGTANFPDIVAVVSLVFQFMMEKRHEKIKVLELNGKSGRISYFLAKSIMTFSERNTLFALDDWKDGMLHFMEIMKLGAFSQNVKQIVCDAGQDMDVVADGSFDIVLVNNNLSGQSMRNILHHAVRKLKTDGLLIGYDIAYDQDVKEYFRPMPFSSVSYQMVPEVQKEKLLKLLAPHSLVPEIMRSIHTMNDSLKKIDQYVVSGNEISADSLKTLLDKAIGLISSLLDAYAVIAQEIDTRDCKTSLAELKREYLSYITAIVFEDANYAEELRSSVVHCFYVNYMLAYETMAKHVIK